MRKACVILRAYNKIDLLFYDLFDKQYSIHQVKFMNSAAEKY